MAAKASSDKVVSSGSVLTEHTSPIAGQPVWGLGMRDTWHGPVWHWYTSRVGDEQIQHTTESALLTAGWREMESSPSDALFHDPLAAGLAGERELRIARSRPLGAWVVAIRTVVIDAFLRSAIAPGVNTVINLGAGLDTRPYRMDLPSSLNWVEVDYPSLVEDKTAKLSTEVPACRSSGLVWIWPTATPPRTLRPDLDDVYESDGPHRRGPRRSQRRRGGWSSR